MKKALPVILIFIALTNIVGFMPLYFGALQEIKSEVKLKLFDESSFPKLLVSDIEYSNPAVFSKTDDQEFNFRGRMYDYKTVKKTKGGYIFYALEDNKESNLIDFLKTAYEQSGQSGRNGKTPFGNLLKSFSKDFVGCFSREMAAPILSKSHFFLLSANETRTGHCRMLQNPPDATC